ncbi:MAG: transglutaminase domain-containing protein [Pseudomonadota bacterium]
MKQGKIQWHWIAGGGFLLLFAVLLAIRLGVFSRTDQMLPWRTTPVVKPIRSDDHWMAIMQAKRKIGYAHRTMTTTEEGYHLEESVLMRINTMGVVQDMRMKTQSDLHADMTLAAFNFDLQSHLFHFMVRGVIKDKEATIHYGTPTAPKKMVLPLQEKPHLSNSMFDALRGKTLKTGDEIVIYVFDPASMGQRPVRLKVFGEEAVTVMGRERKALKLDVDFMGAQQFAWLGEEGDVLREQGLLGMTLERVTKEEALDGLTILASADLTEVASIPANVTIDDIDLLTEITIRLTNIDTKPLFLKGGRQHLKNNLLTIEKEPWPTADAKREHSGEITKFLRPSPFIQSDDPLIVKQVNHVISPRDSDAAKAKKIVDWLYKYIEKRPVLTVPNATETLENRMGDCNEHAVLLAAMARAAGIPAQVEAGLVYQRGRFYYHAWNVLYLGEWITADATLGKIPADVTHIRLVRGGADRQIDLMGVIGKLKLEILETKP